MANPSSPPNSPTLKCNKCESAELVVAKVELLKLAMGGNLPQLASPIRKRLVRVRDDPNLIRVNHQAVVILFGCERTDCGERVPVTYGYGPDGVRVKKGYPHGKKDPIHSVTDCHVQPLPHSKVVAIVDGMNWPGSDYHPATRNSRHWARQFVDKLERGAIPKEVVAQCKTLHVRIDPVTENWAWYNNFMEMKLFDNENVSQMAAKALEQSGLNVEGYQWHQVKQCKEANGSFVFVEVDNGAPVEDGAFYGVKVHK